MSERIHLSLDRDAQATLQKLEGIINNRYDGNKSKFFRDMLMNYDNHSRLKAKKEIIDQRIENLEKEIEDLKLQRKAIDDEIEETAPEEPEVEETGLNSDLEKQFWDRTVELIFKRKTKDSPKKIEKRFNNWFADRKKLYNNKSDENMSRKQFLEEMYRQAEDRGFEDKVEELKQKVEG